MQKYFDFAKFYVIRNEVIARESSTYAWMPRIENFNEWLREIKRNLKSKDKKDL